MNSTMRVLINLSIMVFMSGGVEAAYALENCSVNSNQMDRPLVGYVGGMRYQLKSSSNKDSEVSYDCAIEDSVIESVAASILESSNIEENIVVSEIVKQDAIVVVIDDFGYRNDWVLEGFLNLDASLSYAVIPGNQFSSSTGSLIHDKGYELIIHMPMQAVGAAPGEIDFRLFTTMNKENIYSRIQSALDQFPAAVGMNNHQGSAFTAHPTSMSILASELRRQNLYFLDSVTSANTVGAESMRFAGVPVVERDVFLDSVDDLNYVNEQLDRLAYLSRQHGYAVGIGHVRANTLLALQQSIPRIKQAGHEFVFVSEVVSLVPQ
ncbi:MAG: hypothetical protein CL789_04800 [Chloroflexi bacterium]|nr:hypothetical protein [Chloroflexota bacterium]MBS60771.1 hypothetical protein [Anaerolineaceae bacterium]HCU79645.1 hypothetical protein [Chloroflexota bacterium]